MNFNIIFLICTVVSLSHCFIAEVRQLLQHAFEAKDKALEECNKLNKLDAALKKISSNDEKNETKGDPEIILDYLKSTDIDGIENIIHRSTEEFNAKLLEAVKNDRLNRNGEIKDEKKPKDKIKGLEDKVESTQNWFMKNIFDNDYADDSESEEEETIETVHLDKLEKIPANVSSVIVVRTLNAFKSSGFITEPDVKRYDFISSKNEARIGDPDKTLYEVCFNMYHE